MSKSREELNTLKKEIAVLNSRLAELTEEELEQVTGGDAESEWQVGDWCEYENIKNAFPQLQITDRRIKVLAYACRVEGVAGNELDLIPYAHVSYNGSSYTSVMKMPKGSVPAGSANKIAAPLWAAGIK